MHSDLTTIITTLQSLNCNFLLKNKYQYNKLLLIRIYMHAVILTY